MRHGTEGGAVQDANRGLHSQVQAGPLSKLHCDMYSAHKQRDEDKWQDVEGKEGYTRRGRMDGKPRTNATSTAFP